MTEYYIMRHPQKNYGRLQVRGNLPALLATDYKSPPLILEVEEDGAKGQEHGNE